MRKTTAEFKNLKRSPSIYVPISKQGKLTDQCGISQDIIKVQCRKCGDITALDAGELKRRENFIYCNQCPIRKKLKQPTGYTYHRNKNGFIDRSIRIPNK